MERVFSLEGEEIPNPFWAPPSPPLVQPHAVEGGVGGVVGVVDGGSGGAVDSGPTETEEWCLQKFMEDALLDEHGPAAPAPEASPDAPALCRSPTVEQSRTRAGPEEDQDDDVEVVQVIPAPAVPASEVADPVAYNAMLRRKLEADLAVVARWKASGSGGSGTNLNQNEDVNLISSSSWEPSLSDDDVEGEAETMGYMNPTAHRAKRRKESNRDSARRSRSRKAALLRDLEDQLSDLKVENNSLVRRLTEVVQKCNNSAVDCRVLTAKVETLETKVIAMITGNIVLATYQRNKSIAELKMAEDNLMRATGTTTVAQAISAVSSLSIPFTGYPPGRSAASAASVPIQDARTSYITAPAAAHAGVNRNGFITQAAPAMAAASVQMQPVASVEHLQRTVLGGGGSGRGRPSSSASVPSWGGAPMGPNELANMRMH